MAGSMNDETNKTKDHTRINPEIDASAAGGDGPVKSKKELRLERKAAKKAEAEAKTNANAKKDNDDGASGGSKNLDKEKYLELKKQRRAELRKEEEKLMRKEAQKEKKLRKRKKLNRELNAKGGVENAKKKKQKAEESAADPNNNKKAKGEQDANMDAFRSVFHGGASSENGGMVTTRLGVQYVDKVVGTGQLARKGIPITVKYELVGGKFGAVLDSSKNFTFRLGMGEVIQGWDIGMMGMREGGRRKLIVPPKAGYGGKDIGAGPGALLNFDITLLSCSR